ncbi:MAG: hypothetical protein AAFN92_10180 [Bacteroidota bacterium]
MKHLFTLVLLCSCLGLGAQSCKGKLYLSGNTHFRYGQETPVDNADRTATVQSSQIGYFISERLLMGTEFYLGPRLAQFGGNSNYYLRPFARYYFSSPTKKARIFGQLGMLTVGDFGFGNILETDFHFGAGAEITLTPDLVATGLLRYRAFASGLNYTELALDLNVLVGGKAGPPTVFPSRGSFLLDPSFGSLQFGLRTRDNTSRVIGNLRLNGLYLLGDKLALEGGFALTTDRYKADGRIIRFEGVPSAQDAQLELWAGVRYFFSTNKRFQPYLSAQFRYYSLQRTDEILITTSRGEDLLRREDLAINTYLNLGGGALFFLSERVAIDAAIYGQEALSSGDESGVQGRVGLKVILP